MNTYLIIKALHIISSVLMVGTGFGSAFYLFFANRSNSIAAQAVVSKWVMRADYYFTTPAVIFQPLSGLWMLHYLGMPWAFSEMWLWVKWTFALYALAGICWLPVVWLQIQMYKMAQTAYANGDSQLPPVYKTYQKYWELLGYPAFIAMVVVYFLMVMKPF